MTESLPLNFPDPPAFARESFQHEIKPLLENYAYDDLCMASLGLSMIQHY